ncbi:MAG: hypothetical protein ACOYU5_11740 [Stygiobacter sp.]
MMIIKSGKRALACFLFLLLLTNFKITAQDGWYFTSSVQVNGGKYVFDSYNNLFSIYSNLRYQNGNMGITVSLPLIMSGNNSTNQTGGMMFQSDNSGTKATAMNNGFNIGIGDLYSYLDYKIISDYDSGIDLFVNAQVKVPTAVTSMNIGTGKYDFGGSITLRKSLESFVGFVDLGYLNIGDPDSVIYKNPFTYGIGLGKFFNYGEYSLLLYYTGYTKIIEEYDAPKQLSLGMNYRASETIILTLISSKGFGNTSPDFTLSGGVRIKI